MSGLELLAWYRARCSQVRVYLVEEQPQLFDAEATAMVKLVDRERNAVVVRYSLYLELCHLLPREERKALRLAKPGKAPLVRAPEPLEEQMPLDLEAAGSQEAA